MWNLRTGVTVLIATCVLSVTPQMAMAQGAQYRETDLEFTRRMTARIENIEAQTAQLEKVVVRGWNPTKKEVVRESTESTAKEHVLLGRQVQTPTAADNDEYGRIKVKLNALQEQSHAQRTRLESHATADRAGNRRIKLNREAIEARLSQMERDLTKLKTNMRKLETARK